MEIKGNTKEEVVRALADLATGSPLLKDLSSETIYEQLMERESQGSTGFGNEIAIPHARIEGMEEFLLYIAVSKRGVEFDAMDKKRVKVFFVILGPAEQVNEHLKILASVSRMLGHTNLKKELLGANTRTVVYETFVKNIAEGTGQKKEKQKMKALFIILFIDDFLNEILEFFIQAGIDGATIIDSFGMGEYISNVPLFATFIGFMNENKTRSKTLLTMIPEDREKDILEGIEEITGDLDKKQGAMIITMDVSFYKGSMKML